jgi:hypothetical protein
MCRTHEHLPKTTRRVANNIDKFCVIVADLSQNTEFLFCLCFVSVLSVKHPDWFWGLPSILYSVSFTRLKRHGRGVDPQNHLEPRLKKE